MTILASEDKNKHKFRRLKIWNIAMAIISDTYKMTAAFPQEENYGLSSQLRRASVSMALNIAEGSGSHSDAEFMRYLNISRKSAYELICGMEIAHRLSYIDSELKEGFISRLDEFSAMVAGFVKKLSAVS